MSICPADECLLGPGDICDHMKRGSRAKASPESRVERITQRLVALERQLGHDDDAVVIVADDVDVPLTPIEEGMRAYARATERGARRAAEVQTANRNLAALGVGGGVVVCPTAWGSLLVPRSAWR